MTETTDLRAAFIEAAVWHGSLETAEAILAAHPEIASESIHVAAILGDDDAVRRLLGRDPRTATAAGPSRGWDPLTCLCFSKYLRLDPSRSEGFVRAAEALLDAGASATTGFHDTTHQPEPMFESALYGAAGVAHHAGLTRLLLARGADPNDDEVPYHTPETYDNAALRVLVDSGRITDDNLATMLLRKHDWHDRDGVQWLLERGADANRRTRFGRTSFEHAVLRDNAVEIFEVLLDHGAKPESAIAPAARRGRGDLLELFERRGTAIVLHGVDRLIAACARNDAAAVRAIRANEPDVVSGLIAQGGRLLSEFAGNGNTAGVTQLLELGVAVDARFAEGDSYWDVAADSAAVHVAAWRAQHATVRLLIERGADVNARDGKGRTPLQLSVRACVDSYWTTRRSPESVRALLEAGASAQGINVPCGYAEVDALLRTR